jgi:signal recognition particle receptor subunit beta
MPLDLGTVAGMRTSFQLYTVPGQVYYNSTRKLVLQGVDGIIFIADSSAAMLEQNLESLRNLEENLNEYGKSLATLPHVLQWNKRDIADAMPVAELERLLNHHKAPTFEAIANSGQGVFPTLKALAGNVLKNIMQESGGVRSSAAAAAMPAAATPARAPAFQTAAPAPVAAAVDASGLQLAAPRAGGGGSGRPSTPAPERTAQAAELMQQRPKTAARPARPAPAPAKPQPARRAQAKSAPAPARTPAPAPAKAGKKSSVGLFIVIAGVVGAGAAWFVLNYLG